MTTEWFFALVGGALIGVAVSLMLLFNGRITGISGIVMGVLFPKKGDIAWRWFLILGLIVGGVIINYINPTAFAGQLNVDAWTVPIAGILVGYGTVLGSGCTSGHGVCGISRLSLRSIIATLVFIFGGVIAVALFRKFGVLN